ncbi:MAG: hypothetical protein DSZ09_02710 [Sulfurovum sp.]|nr:MAG: hypothetical protein DSZ09_02710 [Sulfurovum sp.]
MKTFIVFLLIMITVGATESKNISIEGKSYVIVHESYDAYGDKGIEMKLYAKEQNRDTLPLFSFALENQSGGCGERSTVDGSYKINGTTLILYTHWDRSGRAYDTPKGDRIQHYTIAKDGTIHFVDGQIYLERYAKNYDKQSDMQFLFNPPRTLEEKKRLDTYKKQIETLFKAKFVNDSQKNILHDSVEKALTEKRKHRWQ